MTHGFRPPFIIWDRQCASFGRLYRYRFFRKPKDVSNIVLKPNHWHRFGTASVIIYVKGKGIVLREPSVVALDRSSGEVLAVGEDAYQMLGRTPHAIEVIRPLRDGVITNFEVTEKMLRAFLRKVAGRRFFFRPRVVVCVPSGVSEMEKRSVIEVCTDAGAGYARLIEEPLAAAIGAGMPVNQARGCMVVDIGGGTTDVAAVCMGKIVASRSVKVSGDAFDAAVLDFFQQAHRLDIGPVTAEQLKMHIGCALPRPEPLARDIIGRCMDTGLPRAVTVTSDDLYQAIAPCLEPIFTAVRDVFEQISPELTADILDSGIMMTGGGALLYNMDKAFSARIGVTCMVAQDPIACVAVGTGRALENPAALSDVIYDYHGSDTGNYFNV